MCEDFKEEVDENLEFLNKSFEIESSIDDNHWCSKYYKIKIKRNEYYLKIRIILVEHYDIDNVQGLCECVKYDDDDCMKTIEEEGIYIINSLFDKISDDIPIILDLQGMILNKLDLKNCNIKHLKLKNTYISEIINSNNETELYAFYRNVRDKDYYRISFIDNFYELCDNFGKSYLDLDGFVFQQFIEPYLENIKNFVNFSGKIILPTITKNGDKFEILDKKAVNKYDSEKIRFDCKIIFKPGFWDYDESEFVRIDKERPNISEYVKEKLITEINSKLYKNFS